MAIEREDAIPLEGGDVESVPLSKGPATGQASSKIQAFGAAVSRTESVKDFQRSLNLTGAGATRVRMFNAKITLAAMDHLVNQINEWLDGNEIEVKYINQVIGTVEGKKPEPNIIITVWY